MALLMGGLKENTMDLLKVSMTVMLTGFAMAQPMALRMDWRKAPTMDCTTEPW